MRNLKHWRKKKPKKHQLRILYIEKSCLKIEEKHFPKQKLRKIVACRLVLQNMLKEINWKEEKGYVRNLDRHKEKSTSRLRVTGANLGCNKNSDLCLAWHSSLVSGSISTYCKLFSKQSIKISSLACIKNYMSWLVLGWEMT